jgi:CheY-like chemotaxis protein
VSLRPVVLCIDDNVLVLAIRKSLLESRDFRVLTAEDGPAGLEIVNRKPVDVVIVDYEMPGMDGATVAKELRRKHPNLPILLVSGFAGRIPEPLLAIVDGFIAKGSSPDLLIKEVKRVTEAKPKRPEPQMFDVSRKHIRQSHKRVVPSKQQLRGSKHRLQRCRQYRNR